MNILVLGIGNLLLSDEGVGVRVVEALERGYCLPTGVDTLDGGTSGMELMEMMAKREHLIVVDAVRTGAQSGSVVLLHDSQVPALFTQKISPHQLGLCDVLMALRFTDEFPQRLTLVGIVPESLAPGIGLSPTVERSVTTALAQVLTLLAADGVNAVARSADDVIMNHTFL